MVWFWFSDDFNVRFLPKNVAFVGIDSPWKRPNNVKFAGNILKGECKKFSKT